MSNPGTTPIPAIETARRLLGILITAGIRDVVLSPGSRSAPLAYAIAEYAATERLRVHVRLDERSAGFLALGLSQGSDCPVAVIVTSGSAVGQLLPAVMEANHAATKLLVLSADRPGELHGTGASQTTRQRGLFGDHARASLNIEAGTDPSVQVQAALAALDGDSAQAPGPVQLNVEFRDPLVPEATAELKRESDTPNQLPVAPKEPADTLHWTLPEQLAERRTVVLAGHQAGPEAQSFAQALGLPLLAEPSSNARSGPNAIAAYRLLLSVMEKDIERVVLFGRPTLSRPVNALLARTDIPSVIWQPHPVAWYEPGRRAQRVIAEAEELVRFAGRAPQGWLEHWQGLDSQAVRLRAAIDNEPGISGWALAEELWRTQHGPLLIGSSMVIRDLDLSAMPHEVTQGPVFANRGLAGIDGTVSTALGLALASGEPTRAVMGDITFLHDAGALAWNPEEARPDLDVVVFNDAGGAIFSTLEHGAVQYSGRYGSWVERLFATPHAADLRALAGAYGWDYVAITSREELSEVLQTVPCGLRVIEVHGDRSQLRERTASLAQAVSELS
ncbi:2-succinyl-5-enolpyruvyl-6-hydroxy-3-cyclohexene-1-carboxylic-acid synthase [Glutamicibacter endophyticus]|uniref:2-succinyl-5-enolpyruvyl-6-hydroxy-3- cyclohexene-1-carboxylic-acid synthase n=1 Tax=Glutamicibacter endophyticus TaxID=1522174 RepID=UPI003AF15ABC